MTVESVMSGFVSDIEANYDLEMFGSTTVTITDDTTGESSTVTYYSGKEELEKICTAINAAKDSINTGFLYLFNDLEQDHGEHQNFLVINALSEIFRKTQSYSFETKQFTDKLWYAYTCGQIYSSYGKGASGQFLTRLYSEIPINITRICGEYQELYDEFTPSTTPEDPGDPESKPLPKTVQFWQEYGEEFGSEMEPFLDTFNALAADFNWFYGEITAYKELGTNAAKLQAVGNVFTYTDDRTQLVAPSMTEVFASCDNQFQIYDTLVEEMYDLWLRAEEHVNTEYTDLEEWEIRSTKLNVFAGVLLEHINFFSESETMYNEFLTFFSSYGIS